MNTRTEPSIGSPSVGNTNASLLSRVGLGTKSPDKLVADALSQFTAAVENLDKASSQIDNQIAADQAKLGELQKNITGAIDAKGRLTRIKGRVAEFIS